MEPVVSAIITTCKRSPKYIIRALKSVMVQTYQHIEIIVVDDSPVDYLERERVKKAVLQICPQVRYIINNENHGAPAARNLGIQEARGTYIGFLDDDDEWLPKKIEEQLAGFINENIALVYGKQCLSYDSEHCQFVPQEDYSFGRIFEQLLIKNYIGSTSNPLIKKECLKAIGGFDEAIRSAQDYDLYLRLAQQYEIMYVPCISIIYHIHDDDRISTSYQDKRLGMEQIIKKYSHEFNQHLQAWVNHHRTLIIYYRQNGNYLNALRVWYATACKCPSDVRNNIVFLLITIFSSDFCLFRWYHSMKIYRFRKKNGTICGQNDNGEKEMVRYTNGKIGEYKTAN